MPTYGQRPQDLVTDSRGNALRGVTLKLYGSEAAANAGGTPDGTATTDARGRWSYTAAGEVWARLPDGAVWQVSTDEGTAAAAAAAASQAQASAISAAAAAASIGVRIEVSETAPASSTIDGFPVVWLKPTGTLAAVPVLPTSPSWNNLDSEFTVPTGITGAFYMMDGEVLTPGVAIPITDALPATKTITAVAKPGYVLSGTYSWTHTFPDPSATTVRSSDNFNSADLASLAGRVMPGGTTPLTYPSGGYFGITGNQAVNKTATGWYLWNLPYTNHRLEWEITEWGWSSGTTMPLQMSIGGGSASTVGSCAMDIGYGRRYVTASGVTGVPGGLVGTQPLGEYGLEVFDNSFGIKIPGIGWQYCDISAMAANQRGGKVAIRNQASSASYPFKIDNVTITELGA